MAKRQKAVEPKPTARLVKWQNDPRVPELTPVLAMMFAKLLHVGCPPIRAVLYCAPEIDIELAKAVKVAWLNDVEVLQATENLIGGAWLDLPKEDRYRLALDKNLSEMAFYLWTANFGDADGKDMLDKMKMAREGLKMELGRSGDSSDPMQALSQWALQVAQNMAAEQDAKRKRPTQLSGLSRMPDAEM